MNIIKNITVPTGNILVVQGDRGPLECLSIGDYGKDVNIKCDALGLNREPSPVRHTALLPLEEKWVITCSTQYGCLCQCSFCDVPKVQYKGNATLRDLVGQFTTAVGLHPEVKTTKRINLHWARMGEPSMNENVIPSTMWCAAFCADRGWGFHPVLSTIVPQEYDCRRQILRWLEMKNNFLNGEAGLQLSINSTSEVERSAMFHCNASSIGSVSELFWNYGVVGRKITLNFALAGWTINAPLLADLFPPSKFICKLTPMHATRSAQSKGIMPVGDWTEYEPYRETEEALKRAGFDVLVFIASKEEDESRITCGNAVLASEPI